MSQPALTYLEKRWASSWGANSLIEAATQTDKRATITQADFDFHRLISSYGRRTLATLGKSLFWNSDAVRGMVLDIANSVTDTWVAQFEGADQSWGAEAEDWLVENNKFCNIKGGQRSFSTFVYSLIVAHCVEGESFTVLTDQDGSPKLQVFPSHRVGSYNDSTRIVNAGPFSGSQIIDGVIVNEYAAPIGYRCYLNDQNYGSDNFVDVSANDIVPSFMLYTDEQLRGISLLGSSMFNWADANEIKAFNRIEQKLAASIGLIRKNETGEVDSARSLLGPRNPVNDSDGNAQAIATEKVDGVSIWTFAANSGHGVESFKSDKPTLNQRDFVDSCIRDAMAGSGWSFDYSLNPTKAGGAQMRIVMEKINASVRSLIKFILEPTCRRIDGWRISKAIQAGWLKPNDEWYKWSYQGPAELTADKKYDSDVDIQERRAGLTTLRKGAAKRGDYWRDTRNQQSIEIEDKYQRAEADARKHGVSLEFALAQYDLPVGSAVQTTEEQAASDAAPIP